LQYVSTLDGDVTIADWDLAIARALKGKHVEDKLLAAVASLASAQQRSRLRGDHEQVTALGERLAYVHEMLDRV
jgi:hypothetical protein